MTGAGWFDASTWVQDHLVAGLPTWRVSPQFDPTNGVFPACDWDLSMAAVDARGLWRGNVTLNLHVPVQNAGQLVSDVIDVLGSWLPPGPACDMTVLSVVQHDAGVREDLSLFSVVAIVLWQCD